MSVFQMNLPAAIKVTAFVATVGLLNACLEKKPEVITIETEEQKVAYSIGFNFGQQLAASTEGLDISVLVDGMKEGFNGDAEKIDAEERMKIMQSYAKKRQADLAKKQSEIESVNKTAGAAFLEENKTKEGVTVTESGLQYKVITEGKGDKPAATDVVKVHYKGTLLDGTEFDSSIARGEPVEFALNRVIPGWTEGLQLMTVGSKWELFIPSELAYGPGSSGAIEPHSTLIFEVELLDIIQPETESSPEE